MAKGKRYFWYRVNKDFFDKHYIKLMRKQNELYVLIYMMLLAEGTNHDGEIRFSEEQPYTTEDLSVVLGFDFQLIENAMVYFESKELITIDADGTIIMNYEKEMIGSESDYAKKKREYRSAVETKKDNEETMSSYSGLPF